MEDLVAEVCDFSQNHPSPGASHKPDAPACDIPSNISTVGPARPVTSQNDKPSLRADLEQAAKSSFGINLYDDSPHSQFYTRLLNTIQKLEYEKEDLEKEMDELLAKGEESEAESEAEAEAGSHHDEIERARINSTQMVVIHRVYCIKKSYSGAHRWHPLCAHFLDNPRLYKGDNKYSAVRGNQRISDIEDLLKRYTNLSFVVYKDYECGACRKFVKKVFQFTPRSRWVLKRDAPPVPTCHFEEIHMRSALMKSAMEKIEYLISGDSAQWWKSCTMKAPYLPLFYHRHLIEEKIVDELSLEQQVPLRLLLGHVRTAYASTYEEAQVMFSQGLVSPKHFSKLFIPNDVVLGSENGQPCAWLCNDWPEKVSPFAGLKEKIYYRRSDIMSLVQDQSFSLYCSSWSFDGRFRNDKRTLVCQWPRDFPSTVKICDLAYFPLKYDESGIQKLLEHRGKIYWTCRRRTYISYKTPDSQPGSQNVSSNSFLLNMCPQPN